jgi:hypothetical protein
VATITPWIPFTAAADDIARIFDQLSQLTCQHCRASFELMVENDIKALRELTPVVNHQAKNCLQFTIRPKSSQIIQKRLATNKVRKTLCFLP